MSLDFQTKLLRVLEDGVIRRVGGTESYLVDVRMIVAMNEHPLTCIEKGLLRSDLYYRLNVIFIEVPPLRKRKEDISLLVEHFIKKYNYSFSKLVIDIEKHALAKFYRHKWPGNVRELEHAIEYAMNMVEGDTLKSEHLPFYLQELEEETITDEIKSYSLRSIIEKTEKALITEALESSNHNILHAAKLLEIPRQTLQYKMKKYNMTL
jgi:arginine utilization regulatory protein